MKTERFYIAQPEFISSFIFTGVFQGLITLLCT